jgi:dipeptidyl aminopeptidase/acylaminoacyl peptidase
MEDALDTDIRRTALYQEVEASFRSLRQPGTGLISDAADLNVAPTGDRAVFTGTLMDSLEATPPTRICQVDLVSGKTRVLTFGPNMDRMPKYSADGKQIAFLSDRHKAGDFQLYLLSPASGAARPTSQTDGWVEYFHWSVDGSKILLGTAGHGADVSGGQGAITSNLVSGTPTPSWMPAVETGAEDHRWRRVWIFEITTGKMHQVGDRNINIWEASWCGNDALIAVASIGPEEGLWYGARLQRIEIATGNVREIYSPEVQLGCPSASPSGKYVAVVEALCSDRWIVAGDLRLINPISGAIKRIDTNGVDIACLEWRTDRLLLVAGHRGFQTVVATYDTARDVFREVWTSVEISTGGRYITVSGMGESGDCALVGESFVRAPEIATIRDGQYTPVKSFDLGYNDIAISISMVERTEWRAPDGLSIQGWLLRPRGGPPYPLVMDIHGGPVWHARPRWLGRALLYNLMLVKFGYAVFLPNPRGSSGRGQDFARRVLGDMGGADTYDYLTGLDHLVGRGIVDGRRIGVTGGSYGGFMTSWLITQDSRFAAAVPVAPVSNQVSQHLISNIPEFVDLFLADSYVNPCGKYFERSPVMHAHKAKTPTLNICGALDRCTPPEEARQFHNALREHGVKSVLITYPEEGHGIRKFPAMIDFTARMVAWFQEHMPLSVEETRLYAGGE